MKQLNLDVGSAGSIQERFEKFHAANPWVYDELVKQAKWYARRGFSRIGIGHLVEVLRWQYARRTKSTDGFKLNNDFRSRYVRLIIQNNPGLKDFFETRKLQAA